MTEMIADRGRWLAVRAVSALRGERGQGTVEYVALILLIAAVMTAVVATKGLDAGGIAKTIVGKLKNSIDTVGGGGKS